MNCPDPTSTEVTQSLQPNVQVVSSTGTHIADTLTLNCTSGYIVAGSATNEATVPCEVNATDFAAWSGLDNVTCEGRNSQLFLLPFLSWAGNDDQTIGHNTFL